MPTFLCQREHERFRLDELGRSPGGRLVHLAASGAHLVEGDPDASPAVPSDDLDAAEPVEDLTNLDLEDRRVASVELDAEG